ncbi:MULTISPECIES: serine/threonine-protein kinase [Amycolatopsis]|uniref:Serine/threonine-protein kinase n=1 Tax=Amycolatopsis albidoflavus TaxID=102226 RepID=A0ABW5I0X5_9PSEU
MQPLHPGESRQFGRYRLIASLGEGGMGRVLLGVSREGRLVAVKQVHPAFAHDPGFRSRFKREVETSRMVSGAYTAAVMDADPDAPLPWLASVFVAGPSLKEAVDAAGPLPLSAVHFLATGLASALAEIHRVGLIHRDLKPSNVLLAADGPRVIDFGIARAAEGDTDITHTGSIIGSPGFMSPEQANGLPLTPASDVFSFGALVVMAATGRAPFAGASTPQTLYNVVHSAPDLTNLHPDLRRLVEPCLAKDPKSRPNTAQILDFLGTVQLTATPWPPAVHTMIERQQAEVRTALALPVPKEPRKRPKWLIPTVAAATAIVIAAATTVVLVNRDDNPAAASVSPPPPDPLSPAALRRVDPCKLLGPDSLPKSGPLEPGQADDLFAGCAFHFKKDPKQMVILLLSTTLYGKKGEPTKVGSMDAIQYHNSSECGLTVANPATPGFGIDVSVPETGQDTCSIVLEGMTAVLAKLRGNPEPYPNVEKTLRQADLCRPDLKKPLQDAANSALTSEFSGLNECTWRGKKDYSATASQLSDPKFLDGQKTKVGNSYLITEQDADRCYLRWLFPPYEPGWQGVLSVSSTVDIAATGGKNCDSARRVLDVFVNAVKPRG